MASIFTKIIQGEIPSYKIYEDEYVFSFLDIRPVNPGHALVIPKKEVDHITDVPDDLYLKVMEQVQKISRAVHKASGAKRVGIMVQGFEVPHFHVHLIPVNSPGELSFSRAKAASEDDLKSMHQKVLAELN